ncbi:Uncharacterized protein T310_5929, partial [Rasamsonia emersonii CBS 393.64]
LQTTNSKVTFVHVYKTTLIVFHSIVQYIPPPPLSPNYPVTAENMNYAAPVFGAALVFSVGDWFVRGRKQWHGPTVKVATETVKSGVLKCVSGNPPCQKNALQALKWIHKVGLVIAVAVSSQSVQYSIGEDVWDSLVVTHPTTNQPACGLSTAERTGSPVFHTLWSTVLRECALHVDIGCTHDRGDLKEERRIDGLILCCIKRTKRAEKDLYWV